ncbi:MAG: hypothetical protein WCO60_16915 [Verrucomicrobiota bacterium]
MELIRVPFDLEKNSQEATNPSGTVHPCSPAGTLFLGRVPGALEPLALSVTELLAAGITEIVCLAHGAELRVLSAEYAVALGSKQFPFETTHFPIDRNGAPRDVAAFGAVAVSVATNLREGRNILVHGGLSFGRSTMLSAAVCCVLGSSLECALARSMALGPAELNGAQHLALRRLYAPGVTASDSIQPLSIGVATSAAAA